MTHPHIESVEEHASGASSSYSRRSSRFGGRPKDRLQMTGFPAETSERSVERRSSQGSSNSSPGSHKQTSQRGTVRFGQDDFISNSSPDDKYAQRMSLGLGQTDIQFLS
mmetsp:Transcript_38980/g.59269  ORF Transcript_38980/g.59269 Transcript_38980/m.59269 type:complete len:109 (-) Transcript_38980:1463-1789(-)